MTREKENESSWKTKISKLELELKSLNSRIEELIKLADFKARTYKENMLKSGLNFKPYDDDASDFSEMTDSELGDMDSNALEVLIRHCDLDELFLRRLLGGKMLDLDGLQTMVAVDFFNHDTQHSEISEGLKPNYNFQLSFKVNVDEGLINYMEHEYLRVRSFAFVALIY